MRFINPWRAWVDGLSSKLAFFPPPPTYSVLRNADKLVLESSTDTLDFEHIVKKVRTRPTRRGGYGADETTVVAVFIPFPRGTRTDRCTILCSHGNAVDLGQMLPIYKELSQLLKVNIMAYDFSGYGCSTGVATANQTLADIQAVFDCLVEEFGVPINRIVLYGQSVGSGPTSWLGAQEQALAGVVLHSPLLSGVRVLHPNISWWPSWADVFPNQIHVPHIQAPVLIMHGTEDEVIHISCGQRLAKLVKHPWPHLWAEGYNHQNLEACPQYLPSMARFIAHVTKR